MSKFNPQFKLVCPECKSENITPIGFGDYRCGDCKKRNEDDLIVAFSANQELTVLKEENERLKKEMEEEFETSKLIRRKLQAELTALREQNEKLVKALEFYADGGSWFYPGNDYHDFLIAKTDVSKTNRKTKAGKDEAITCGGKRARQCLDEVRKCTEQIFNVGDTVRRKPETTYYPEDYPPFKIVSIEKDKKWAGGFGYTGDDGQCIAQDFLEKVKGQNNEQDERD